MALNSTKWGIFLFELCFSKQRNPEKGIQSVRTDACPFEMFVGYSFFGTASSLAIVTENIYCSGRIRSVENPSAYVIFLVAHILLYITNNERIIIIIIS